MWRGSPLPLSRSWVRGAGGPEYARPEDRGGLRDIALIYRASAPRTVEELSYPGRLCRCGWPAECMVL